MRPVVHLEHLADNVGVAAELGAPVGVAQHQDRLGAAHVVRRHERAADHRLDAEQIEEVRRHHAGVDAIGLAAVDQIEVHLVVLDQAVEDVGGALAVVEVLGDGHAGVAPPGQRRRLLDHHQPVAVLIGQRLQQHAVDDAEDGGVGADAEAERQHRQQRVAGMAQQRPRAVLQIRQQRFEPADAARIARFFLVLFHWSETPERLQPRVIRAHAKPDVLLGFHLDVKPHFRVETAVEFTVTDERVQSFPHRSTWRG